MGVISGVVAIVFLAIISDTIIKIAKARGGGFAARDLADLRRQLEDQNDTLARQDQQIQELQERTDFMERLLAQSRERPPLGPGGPPPS